MIWAIAVILLCSIGVLFFVLTTSGKKNLRGRSQFSTFINHPECFVRITDKTNYPAIEVDISPSNPSYPDVLKEKLEVRVYDIRSMLYNMPQGTLTQYKEVLSFHNDIYDLLSMMQSYEPYHSETAYIYKSSGAKGAEIDDSGVCTFGFNSASLNSLTKLGILKVDHAQTNIKRLSDGLNIQELIDIAQINNITLVGNTQDELFRSAYNAGLLSKIDKGDKSCIAYMVTKKYFEFENVLFETYCNDLAKNLEGVHKIYREYIVEQACKVNVFSKEHPKNRLTNMIQKLKVSSPSI